MKNGEQMLRFISITPGKDVLSYISKADGQEIIFEPEFFFCKRKNFIKRRYMIDFHYLTFQNSYFLIPFV